MASNNDKDRFSKESLKAVEDFIKKTEQGKKNIQDMNDLFGNMATQLFGISGAAFFTELPKTTEELRAQRKAITEIKNELDKSFQNIGDALGKEFESALSKLEAGPKKLDTSAFEKSFKDLAGSMDIKSFSDLDDLEQKLIEAGKENTAEFKKFSSLKEKFRDEEKKYIQENEKFYDNILKENPNLLANLTERERKQKLIELHQIGFNEAVSQGNSIIQDLAMHSVGVDESIAQSAIDAGNLADRLGEAESEAGNLNKKAFSFSKGIKDMTKNFSAGILPKMFEFDQAISDAGKNFGFVEAKSMQTSMKMAELGQGAARFNMSMGDAINMMGGLGEELATINEVYLADAVENFVAIEKATGLSTDETNKLAGEMMRAGQSAEDVKDYVEESNKWAKLYGVNSKKMLQGISRNIDKMRQMGFVGGEESLTRMVATADRLRMNVDEIFDVAKRARTIEGAMDMASELQLAGGSFAAINPMDLLSAARKGPEELQKILTGMGDDIGAFNKKGEFKFDPVDVDRLQIVADATGQSLDSIQKMIQKNAEDAKKADFMPDLAIGEVMGPDGEPLDQDMMNNMLKDSVDINGEIMEGSLLDEAGVDSLADLTSEQAQSILQDHVNKQKSLEEQAEANQSFQESITAFKDAIFNMFTVFEPFIKILTSFIQTINGMPGPIKMLVAALIGFAMIAPKLGMALEGFKAMAGGAKGLIGKIKEKVTGRMQSAAPEVSGSDSQDSAPQGKGETGLERLAKGLKAMGTDFGTVMKGVLATALAGPALLLLLPGIPTLFLMAGVGALGKFVEAGFQSLGRGISALGNAKGVIKGAAVMILIGASLIPFAFALSLFTGVDWGAVGMAALMLLATVGTLILLGLLLSTPAGLFLMIGALGLVAVGLALMAFGASIMVFASAAAAMQGMEFGWLGDLGWNLLAAAPGLLLGGLALMVAAPGLMMGAMALAPIVDLAERVSGVDWSSFSQMGNALLAVIPGLLAFSAGALVGGLMSGLGSLLGGGGPLDTLQQLADIAMVASDPLMVMSEAIDGLADGLDKLSSAASALDVEKLEMLRNLSWSMAIGAIGGGLMGDSINKIAEALAKLTKMGEGGKGGGTTKIQVDLKLNGRDLQSIIIDDTEIVT